MVSDAYASYTLRNTTKLTVSEIDAQIALLDYGLANHVSPAGFNGVIWGGIGIATILMAARFWIRLAKTGRLAMDDHFMFAAYVFLVLNGILQTLQNLDIYNVTINAVRAQFYAMNDLDMDKAGAYEFFDRGTRFLKYEFTIIGFFWTILWLVKASFLAFFYTLFEGLPKYRRIWWAVVVFAFLSYAGCWIASANTCHPGYTYFTFGACDKPIDQQSTVITIVYSTVVDILIDVMIMAMPLSLLWKVQISTRQKLGLAGVFCVGFIIVIFAIIRAVQVTATARTDTILLAFWGILESTVAVIVGCLPPFKSLFSKNQRSNGYYENGYGTNLAASRRRNGSVPLQSHATTRSGMDNKWKNDPRSESSETIVERKYTLHPLRQIMVKNEVSIVTRNREDVV